MDWRAKVELFEEIRREYEFGVGTIAGVSKKLKVHRRMVREAIGSALPKLRKKTERPRWKIAAAAAFVDQILEADRKAPRKQRHTAYRIWQRIQQELPDCRICSRTVRQYVHDRKLELGQIVHETFIPQSYDWGVERKWTGTKPTPMCRDSERSCKYSRCEAWRAARRSTARFCMPHSRRFWKGMSSHSRSSAACFVNCATTT